MAWGRLALIQAAGEGDKVLQRTAAIFGYAAMPEKEKQEQIDEVGSSTTEPAKQLATGDTKTSTATTRPPARFLRVNQIVRIKDPAHAQRPDYLDDPAMRLNFDQQQPGTYRFAAPRPLMPLARLLPFLLNSLGRPVMNGRLDHRKLTRQISQGKPLHRLPYRLRQRWPQRLQLIVDCRAALEPYWSDFALLVGALKNLLGEEAVDAVRLEDDRLDRDDCLCIAWPGKSDDHWRQWQPPAADVSVLILSDLGVSEADGHAQIRWQRFARRLHRHTAPILTLSPAQQSPGKQSVCRLFKPNPLNDQQSLPRHPGRNGFTHGVVDGGKLRDMLALLSVLPVVDSGLLRRLRDGMNWGGSAWESILWNHADINRTGLGIRLKESVAETYRQRYQQKYAKSEQAEKL